MSLKAILLKEAQSNIMGLKRILLKENINDPSIKLIDYF